MKHCERGTQEGNSVQGLIFLQTALRRLLPPPDQSIYSQIQYTAVSGQLLLQRPQELAPTDLQASSLRRSIETRRCPWLLLLSYVFLTRIFI